MTNWCVCTLEITGDPDDVRACLATMSSPDSSSADARLFDFDRVVPIPDDLRERLMAPPRDREDSFDARLEIGALWGTGWNADGVAIERHHDGGGAVIKFYTAWGPPRPVIETLADRFPGLEFDYDYSHESEPIAGRARRAPGELWATIHAAYDDGFCRAAMEAKSWLSDMWHGDKPIPDEMEQYVKEEGTESK